MIKNFNDFISLVTLIVCSIIAIKLFFGALFSAGKDVDNTSKVSLLKDYINNEED